ncbi:uncharacterized protein LOC134820780 [Bolinopsis microptera]|uniref:uncharacterized protein LOC134820780 n=1 Tax=Bolinopsis microptera TaxID=2820187 RepID=UPI003079DBB3
MSQAQTSWRAEKWRAVFVFAAIYLQSFVLYGCSVVSISFYVSYLIDRGIPNIQVGLIGMFPCVGYVFNLCYDLLDHLLVKKNVSLKVCQCMFFTVAILNCVGQGAVDLIPSSYNDLLVLVLTLQRAVSGYVGFLASKGTVECCRVWFPDHMNLIIGLECGAYYFGGALVILMGGYVYEAFSFKEPFLVFGFVAVLFLLFNLATLPKTSDPVLVKAKEESAEENIPEAEHESKGLKESLAADTNQGLSWKVIFPLLAQAMTLILEGFSTSITTPYLLDEFQVPLGKGSSYVFVFYIASFLGCSVSGVMLQRRCGPSKIVAAGSISAALGVLLIFPGQVSQCLYNLVPQTAYLGMFLQGYGCQLVAVASLPAVEEVHVVLGGRQCTRAHKSAVSTLWLCSWMLSVYAGHMVALMVIKYMTCTLGGWIMAVSCTGAAVVSIAQDVAIHRSKTAPPRPEV